MNGLYAAKVYWLETMEAEINLAISSMEADLARVFYSTEKEQRSRYNPSDHVKYGPLWDATR